MINIRKLHFSGGQFQLNYIGVFLSGYCRAGSVTITLPFWWSHGRILLTRDTFEQIIRERGVSWLSCFYWQDISAASDSRDSCALSSSPTPRTRLGTARIRSASSRRPPPPREPGGGQNEGPRSRKWNCHCRSLREVSLHVRVLSFRFGENVAVLFCAVL